MTCILWSRSRLGYGIPHLLNLFGSCASVRVWSQRCPERCPRLLIGPPCPLVIEVREREPLRRRSPSPLLAGALRLICLPPGLRESLVHAEAMLGRTITGSTSR